MLQKGDTVSLFVTVVQPQGNLVKIWAQTNTELSQLIENLMTESEAALASRKAVAIRDVQVGDVFLAKFHEDNRWYRAKVSSVTPTAGQVTVFFIDYGNEEVVGISEIAKGREEHFHLPPQASPFLLADIESRGIQWTKEEIEGLSELLIYGEFQGVVVSVGTVGNPPTIRVIGNESSAQNLPVATSIISSGFGKAASGNEGFTLRQTILESGQNYHVYVVFYESPLNFWMQLVERQEVIEKLQDAIVQDVSDSSPTASPITVGTVCVAKYKDVANNYETFYRSVVTNVLPDGKCEVLFVDYGNRETLSPQELKSMPSRFREVPSMAIQSCLHGSVADAADFQRMLESENIYARVRSVTDSGLHVVNLSDGPAATEPPPRENGYGIISSPQNTNASDSLVKVVKQYKPLQFNVGKQVDLCISHVENTGKFYCQLLENAPRLNQLMHTIDQMNNIIGTPVTTLKAGMPCIARSNTDKNVYYRSKIIGPSQESGKVEVQHVDFGVTEMVPSSFVFHIEEELMELPAQAIHCSLADSDNHKASAVVNVLKKYESKTALVGGVMLKSGSLYEMELVDTSGRQDVFIVKQLSANATANATPTLSGYTSKSVSAGQWLDVELTYIEDPGHIYCQFVQSKSDLDYLMSKVAAYCNSGKAPSIQQAVLGLPCLAKFSEDGGWYRALISGVKASGETEVQFVDYGNHDLLSKDSLRFIPPEFCQLPKQCICVSLEGIDHSTGWSEQETNVLFELAAEDSHPAHIVSVSSETYHAQIFDSTGTNINEKFGRGIGKIVPNFINRGPVPKKVNGIYSLSQPKPAATAASCTSPTSPTAGWAQWQATPAPLEQLKIRSIEVGSVYKDVLVEYVISPSEFYCCLAETADSVADMMEELNNEYADGGPPNLANVQPGAICCAKDGEEWYRAEVLAVHGQEVQVNFFDYGNKEIVSAKDVKILKPTYAKLPRQAIPCTLGGIAPVNGTWSPQAIAMFENLTSSDKNLVAAFTGQHKKEMYSVELIETVAGGQRMVHQELINARLALSEVTAPQNAVSDALMRGSRAIRGSTSNPSASATTPSVPVLSFKLQNLPLAQTKDVNVVHVETPNLFWVQLTEYSTHLEALMEELHEFYSVLGPQQYRLPTVQQGMACVARFTEDSEWYRAEVLNVAKGEILVRYVDYGNVEVRPLSEIWEIQAVFMKLPSQAVQCTLNSVTAPPTGWAASAKVLFEDMVSDKNLLAEVVSVSPKNVYSIKLAEVVNNSHILVANKLVHLKVAAFTTPPMSPGRPVTGRHSPKQSPGNVDRASRAQNKRPPARAQEESSALQSYPDHKLRIGEKIAVNIVWLLSPTSFWCQLVSSKQQLEEMTMSLCEHYEKLRMSESAVSNPQPGQPCVAIYAADGNWYRSQVLRTRNREAEVLYVDFGNKEIMQWSKLKQIEPRFLNIPPLAIHCALKDMDTYQNKFNGKVEEYFLELMQQTLDLTVVALPKAANECLIVALEDGKGNDATEHIAYLSGKTVTPVMEPVPLLASPPRPQRIHPTAATPPRSTVPREVVLKNLNTPLRPGTKSKLVISNIEDISLFYCQLKANTAGLDNFMETLEDYYAAGQGTPLQMSQVKSGMACVSKFSEDGFWYRARVTRSVPPNKVEVLFVDYGNSEETTVDKTCQLNPKFADYPIQAFPCCLKGMCTAPSTDALLHFRELVEGKDLLGVVTRNCDPAVEVELTDAATGANINAVMIEKFGRVLSPKREGPGPKFPVQPVPSSDVSVYISHVDSPASFWVQLESKEAAIQELADTLFTDYDSFSANDHQLENVGVGCACVAKFSDDEAWYRSEVEKVDGNRVTVRFIDYGNADTVSKQDLKAVIPKYISVAPLALHCRLSGIKAPQSGWSSAHNAILEGLDSALQASFCGSDCPVSVKITMNGKNVAEKFGPVEEEFNNNLNVYPAAEIPKGSVTAYASHIEDGFVYLQLASQADTLQSVSDQLQEVYATMANNKMILPAAEIGVPCCARFSEDDAWYRAVVEDASTDKIQVRFVDFGNKETSTSAALKQVKPGLLRLAPLAFRVQIEGMKKPRTGWPDGYQEKLEELLIDQEISTTFVNKDLVKMAVDGLDVTESIKALYPQMSGEEEAVTSEVAPQPEPVKPVLIQEQSCLNSGAIVLISEVVSPSNFFVQVVDTLDELSEYSEGLQVACEGLTSLPNPRTGEFCCARFSEDGALYRAVVTNVDEKVSVRFVDYGNSDTIPRSDVFPLPAKLGETKAYAGCYQLMGGTVDWSPEQTVQFSELVEGKELKVKEVTTDTDPAGIRFLDGDVDINVAMGCILEGMTPQIELPTHDIPVDGSLAYVSHIENPNEIYLQLSDDEDILQTITDTLEKDYGDMEQNVNLLGSAEVGSMCCAKFSVDEAWYRAKIEETSGEKIKVRFVDFGNCEETTMDSLKSLTVPFQKQAALAFCCQIEGVNLPEGKWPENFEVTIEELLMDQVISVTFLSAEPPYLVKMIVNGDDIANAINPLLNTGESGTTLKTEEEPDSSGQSEVKTTPPPGLDVGEKVIISEVKSCTEFYVQCVKAKEDLELLFDKLSSMAGGLVILADIKCGQMCLAQTEENGKWYRAKITDEGEELARVLCIDYGSSSEVEIENLRAIPEEMEERPPYALPYQLVGDDSQWTEEQVEQFKKVTNNKELCVQEVCTDTQPPGLRLTVEGLDVNNLIVTYHSAAPSTVESEEEFVETTEEVRSEPVALLTVEPKRTSRESSPGTGDLSSDEEFADAEDGRDEPIEDLNARSDGIEIGDKFEVEVLNVKSPSQFWCQLMRDVEQLTMITDGLVESGGSGDYIHNPTEGQICAAKYLDDEWYRAKVLSIGEEQVTAFFIDYGSEEDVYKSDLRILPETISRIKPQAIACLMDGICPAETTWSPNAKLRFEELVEEKTLIAEVMAVGNTDSQNFYSFKLLDMGISLAQKLKDEGHAVDGDGKALYPFSKTGEEETRKAEVRSPDKSEEYTYRDLDQAKATLTFGADDDVYETDIEEIVLPSAPELAIGQRVEVTVTHVESFLEFYVQLKTKKMFIDVLTDDLIEAYESNSSELPPELKSAIKEGMVFAAECTDDQCWFRSEVKQVEGEEITVQYVDFGNIKKTEFGHLQLLKPRFHSQPKQAIVCGLYGSGEYDMGQLEVFIRESLNKTLLAVVEEIMDGRVIVKLLDMGIDICTKLEKVAVEETEEIPVSENLEQASVEEDDGQLQEISTEELNIAEMSSAHPEETEDLQEEGVRGGEEDAGGLEDRSEIKMAGKKDLVEFLCPVTDDSEPTVNELSSIEKTTSTRDIEDEEIPFEKCAQDELPDETKENREDIEYVSCRGEGEAQDKKPAGTLEEKMKMEEFDSLNVEQVKPEDGSGDFKPSTNIEALEKRKDEKSDPAMFEVDVEEEKAPSEDHDRDTEVSNEKDSAVGQERHEQIDDIVDAPTSEDILDRVGEELASKLTIEKNASSSEDDDGSFISDIGLEESLQLASNADTKILPGMLNIMGNEQQDQAVTGTDALPSDTPLERVGTEECETYPSSSEEEDEAFISYTGLDESLHRPGDEAVENDDDNPQSISGSVQINDGERDDMIEVNDEQAQVDKGEQTRSGTDLNIEVQCTSDAQDGLKNGGQSSDRAAELDIDEENMSSSDILGTPAETRVMLEEEEAMKQSQYIFRYPSFEPHGVLEVYTSLATSPGKFWCQLIKSSTTDLPLLSDRIQDHCSTATDSLTVESLTPGMACIAKCSLDKNWYRGLVTDITGDDVSVYYVDYGNSEDTNVRDLRAMVPEFLELDVQAFRCKLADIESNDGNDWDDTSSARFDELVTDKDLLLKIRETELTSDGAVELLTVDLRDGPLSIAQALIDGGYAQARPVLNCEDELKNEEKTQSDLNEEKTQSDLKPQDKDKLEEVEELLSLPLEPEAVLDVFFHRGPSPDDFVLHAKENSEKLQALLERLAAQEGEEVTEVKIGMSALVGSKRVKVLEAATGDQCKVEYVDEGYSDYTDNSSLRQLCAEDTCLPPQAIKSRLAGIEAETWSEESLLFFQGLTSSRNLSARVVDVTSGVHHVYLYDMDDPVGSSINAQLVSKGFAWVIANSELSLEAAEKEFLTDDLTDLESSFLEVNDARRQSFGSLSGSESEEGDVVGSNDFARPSLKAGEEMEVEFLSAVDPENITCHLKGAKDRLAELAKTLEECATNGAPPAANHLYTGDACLAMHGEMWRRAKVLTNDETSIVVRHVDYDVVESVSLEKLRLVNDTCKNLPTQAILCGLAGIKPTDDKWHADCASLIKKSCVSSDQDSEPPAVTLKILSLQGDELAMVQLKKGINQDVADLLVAEGLAERDITEKEESPSDMGSETGEPIKEEVSD